MAEVIDYGGFADRLGARTRWETYRAFHQEWGYEAPGGEPAWPRWSQDEHKAYVRRLRGEGAPGEDEDDPFESVDLSLPIPKALDEWWDLPFNSFAHTPRLYWTHPEYPPTVRPDPSGYGVSEGLPKDNPYVSSDSDLRVCVFKAEYQYCNEWGYLAAEAGQEDPRVLVSVAEDEWVLQARSISEFFLLLAVQRVPAALGWSLGLDYDDLEDGTPIQERLAGAYREMGLLPWRELGADTLAYGGQDVIALHDRGGMSDCPLLIAGRTREALIQAADRLDLEWSDETLEPPAQEEAS
ncbi:hypothetical protein ACQEU6_26215 [Spirillospora sp. CA-108201]